MAVLAVSPVDTFGAGEQGLQTAIAAQERHTDRLLAIPGVVGTAVGHGSVGRAAIFVFTKIPGIRGIPAMLDGLPVVARVTGEIFALHHCKGKHAGDPGCSEPPPPDEPSPDPTARWERPVPIGVSTGHPNITAGTIGARVTDGTDVYALSNNHVYALSNNATIGNVVLQPGVFDGGSNPADVIGTLSDFEQILFDGSDNFIDAAIALSSTSELSNATPPDGDGIPNSATTGPTLNAKVRKYGRTTGLTKAMVFAVNATVNVCYAADAELNCTHLAIFRNQIAVMGEGFSRGGDSGSLVSQEVGKGKNKTLKPIGLLFAGNGAQFTFINPIDRVLARFGVTIDGN